MNKHIELVKKWQAGEEVSVEALQANADAAWAAWADDDDDAYAAEPAYVAARAARAAARAAAYDAYADYWADNVDYWVKRYEELTNGK